MRELQVQESLVIRNLPPLLLLLLVLSATGCWFDNPRIRISTHVGNCKPRDIKVKPVTQLDFALPEGKEDEAKLALSVRNEIESTTRLKKFKMYAENARMRFPHKEKKDSSVNLEPTTYFSQNSKSWSVITAYPDGKIAGLVNEHGKKTWRLEPVQRLRSLVSAKDYEQFEGEAESGYVYHILSSQDAKASCGLPTKPLESSLSLTLAETDLLPIGEGVTPFTPGCYDDDHLLHEVKLNLVVDAGFYEAAGGTRESLQAEIEAGIAPTIVVFLIQFNIEILVNQIIVGDINSPDEILRQSKKTSTCPATKTIGLENFREWVRKYPTADSNGFWHLLSDCSGGGIAWINTMCKFPSNTAVTQFQGTWWGIFAHEIGHNFGANHTEGLNGGIMGSTDRHNGAFEFHPELNKAEMCEAIKTNSKNCDVLVKDSNGVCGNQILEPGEECECLNGSRNCKDCIACQLTRDIQCSTADFVMRQSNKPNNALIAVSEHELATTECCDQGLFKPQKTPCNQGKDLCDQGICVPAPPNPPVSPPASTSGSGLPDLGPTGFQFIETDSSATGSTGSKSTAGTSDSDSINTGSDSPSGATGIATDQNNPDIPFCP